MTTSLGLFASRGPWHIVTYGILTGSEFWNSFPAGLIAFNALPRPQFAQLQKALFPPYFTLQTTLPVILALTFPAERTAIGMTAAGIQGVLEPAHRWNVLVPLLTIFTTSLVNLVYLGPTATKVMMKRKHQETIDGKKSYDLGPHSKAMEDLNRSFFWLHSASSTFNLVASIASVCYGFYLGDRLL